MSPITGKELTEDASLPHAIRIREQLRRLLAHPLFLHSKRYPVLLAYTVEQALNGNSGDLKERTIGVEAFGRDPGYDVNLDPVVRTTAAEVRKRLIQYYYNPEHAEELVIELPLGSYIPSFREPMAVKSPSGQAPVEQKISSLQAASATEAETRRAGSLYGRNLPIAGLVVLAVLMGFGLGRLRLPARPSDQERFWAPITTTNGSVTYCLGVPVEAIDQANRRPEDMPNGSLNLSDVTALARLIEPLVSRNIRYRVIAAPETGYTQLREAPFVLIGAFDNPWTMRITQDLPIGFELNEQGRRIVDRAGSQKRFWSFQWEVPNSRISKDYAVIARIHDKVTGQPVIVLAGILGEGTEAASEVISNPVYLQMMLQKAPKNWEQLNLEAVIETHIIDGHPGPPSVVAVESW